MGADVGVEPTSSGNEPNDLPFVLSAIKKKSYFLFLINFKYASNIIRSIIVIPIGIFITPFYILNFRINL